MELTIRQPCPTCGAEITLKEDDRLIQCAYCDVNNYMVHRKLPRFILPARLPGYIAERDLYYVPYLRFKGAIFYCLGKTIHHKLIDTTRVGFDLNNSLHVSLGLRPQAMSLSRVTRHLQGKYVHQSIPAKKIFSDAAKLTTLFSTDKKSRPHHRAFIGETLSRVYLPVYAHRGVIYDGVTNLKLGSEDLVHEFRKKTVPFRQDWEPAFLSTICPGCGDTMHGSRDSLVMSCNNCETAWEEVEGKFSKLDFDLVAQKYKGGHYLPFWILEPEVEGYELTTLADFIRMTNQPIVPQKIHREKRLAIVVPAFKVKPQIYLTISKNLTLLQAAFQNLAKQTPRTSYPVTLPFDEAVQSLKSVLVGTAVSQEKVIELLDTMSLTVTRKKLLYLPFRPGRDLIQDQTGVSLSSASLSHGRSL